jgi:predicted dithiol-disulfide oxidoreductase (DUF899 family)
MSLPPVVSREQWLADRKDLLDEEKALTRARDAVNARRRRLGHGARRDRSPPDRPRRRGRPPRPLRRQPQLFVHHFMFDPAWDDGCPSCTWAADEHDEGLGQPPPRAGIAFATVSRAPFAKLDDYRRRRGWTFPVVLREGTSFNEDLGVTVDWSVPGRTYNYLTREDLERRGEAPDEGGEYPGYSCFVRDGDDVFTPTRPMRAAPR